MTLKRIPAGRVVSSFTVPSGNYDVRIAEFSEEASKSGLLMFVVEYRVLAPETLRGKGVTERFVIGKRPFDISGGDSSDEFLEYAALDDPEADEELTWVYSRDFRKFKERCIAANWDGAFEDSWDRDELGTVIDQKLGLKIIEEVQQEGKYAGRSQNVVVYSYPFGDIEPALEQKEAKPQKKAASKPPKTKPRNRRAATERQSYDDDDDE